MKTTRSKLLFLVMICLILVSSLIPASAQDNPTAVPTVQQPVVPVPLQPTAQPETTNQETTSQKDNFLSLTLGEALAIVLGTAAIFIGLGKILWDANQNPGGPSVDERVTTRLQESQMDRPYIEALENAYKTGNAALQKALDSSVGILQIIAPQTSIKMDNALLSLLQDIQKQGAPLMPSAPGVPGVEVNVNGVPAVPRYEAQTPLSPQNPLTETSESAG